MLPTLNRNRMRTFACIGFPVMVIVSVLLWHKEPPDKHRDSALSPLPKGRTNPPLERLGNKWPIPTGAEVWYGTNQLPCGVIVECEQQHEFDDGMEDCVAIRFAEGNLITWVPRSSTKGLWIRAEKAK
jgi:hypothetical protein